MSVFLPICIIPLLIIVAITVRSNFTHLEINSNEFDESIVEQITLNLDYFYTQYEINLKDITNIENFVSFISKKKFKSVIEELTYQARISSVDANDSLWQKALSRIKGDVCLVQLDKKSLLRF